MLDGHRFDLGGSGRRGLKTLLVTNLYMDDNFHFLPEEGPQRVSLGTRDKN